MGEVIVIENNLPLILVVDDEPEIREIIMEILGETDATILSASNGEEALIVIDRYPIDLIISDVNMPKMGGFELLKQVHQNHPDILTIIITSAGDKETILKALQLHAFDFFEKPITADFLISKVKNILEVCNNKKLLKLALKEWMLQRFSKLELSDFEKKSLNEQNAILKATLEILKFKSLSKSNIKKGVRSA